MGPKSWGPCTRSAHNLAYNPPPSPAPTKKGSQTFILLGPVRVVVEGSSLGFRMLGLGCRSQESMALDDGRDEFSIYIYRFYFEGKSGVD